jgi:hypothetical protein
MPLAVMTVLVSRPALAYLDHMLGLDTLAIARSQLCPKI